MCNCVHHTCPYCDPGIEAFYQQKLKEAKEMSAAHLADTGIDYRFEDNLDAEDIWYEYCELRAQEEIDNYWDEIYIKELETLQEKLDHME
jgi:hypothetical protein